MMRCDETACQLSKVELTYIVKPIRVRGPSSVLQSPCETRVRIIVVQCIDLVFNLGVSGKRPHKINLNIRVAGRWKLTERCHRPQMCLSG